MRPEKISDPRPACTPTLSQIHRENGFANAVAVLVLAIHEVKEWFNVKNNLTPDQEAMTAELILDNPDFYDLTLGNIKACFRQKMMSEKLYDRLDGNIIIGWLREFKSEMADYCETVKEGNDRVLQREETSGDVGAITHEAYMAMLEARANDGDKQASAILTDYRKRSAPPGLKEQRKKELDFFKFKQKYIMQQKSKNQKLDRFAEKICQMCMSSLRFEPFDDEGYFNACIDEGNIYVETEGIVTGDWSTTGDGYSEPREYLLRNVSVSVSEFIAKRHIPEKDDYRSISKGDREYVIKALETNLKDYIQNEFNN